MLNRLTALEQRCYALLGRKPLQGSLSRAAFWLGILVCLFFLISLLPGIPGSLANIVWILLSPVLFLLLVALVYRYLVRHLLWTVRNRLILTSLLMGLAPIVLFATLAGVAAYLFSGQFATNAAVSKISDETSRLRDRATAASAPLTRRLELPPRPAGATRLQRAESEPAAATGTRHEAGLDAAISVALWVDGVPSERNGSTSSRPVATAGKVPMSPLAQPTTRLPGWLQPGFSGVIEMDQNLYLCAAVGDQVGTHTVLGLASTPLNRTNLQALAQDLGSISIFHTFDLDDESSSAAGSAPKTQDPKRALNSEGKSLGFAGVDGGTVPPSSHLFDGKVFFTAPLQVTDWYSGQPVHAMIGVVSRPTLLYSRLFATSVHIGALVRNGLIAITILFSMLELVALLLAIRLSRTITQSIAELYDATTQIDSGNLEHRIRVRRKDQLGALATSFNTMAGSMAELLVQQREKQRMQSELAIAQEVQNNLFPHTPIAVPGFELHGVCKPARTVSGDYYDFILSGQNGGSDQLCLALGDISGKGISAALLMASLHSAVRAYQSGEPLGGVTDGTGNPVAGPSPGRLLALLNRHLYSSTQPEKYATLFLACYDSLTQRLTYSNGGHLTPLILSTDGTVQRLECGGSVVGLLDGMEYAECTVQLHAGDLIVVYSDGLTEPENEFGEFGEERLLALVREHRHRSLSALAATTIRELEHWIGDNEQPDDMTLVLARQL
jgi:sigma-B regulation protein RsbU (phosphoserine phosphatase)